MQVLRRYALFVLSVLAGFIPRLALADKVQEGLDSIRGSFPQTRIGTTSFSDTVTRVIDFALYFAAILAVAYIIYGGYLYITAGGDEKKAAGGRVALTNALIGLVLIIFSYVIVQVVYRFTLGN